MSAFTSLRTAASRASASVLRPGPISVSAVSAFHTSTARSTLKESDQNRDDLPQEYESHKENNLRSVKEGKGKWMQELASNSEAAVKADRDELPLTDEYIKALQEKTKQNAEKKK